MIACHFFSKQSYFVTKHIRSTVLQLYFCVFQRELVLVTSYFDMFLELLHISLAPAGKLKYCS